MFSKFIMRHYGYISQGSRLVFQTMVFQLVFATLNMFFIKNSNSSLKKEVFYGKHF